MHGPKGLPFFSEKWVREGMHLLFVTQEMGKIPSGVVTVLSQLCRCWPESDQITVLMNPTHWAGTQLQRELEGKGNIRQLRVPSILMNDRMIASLLLLPRSIRIISRIALVPISAAQSLLLLLWLVGWMRRHKVAGILSHNGGWPGGMLNRWAIYAGKLAHVPERIFVIHNTPSVPIFLVRKILDALSSWLVGRLTTRIVTVSNACRESLEQQVGYGRSLDVVYNGILDSPVVPPADGVSPPWKKAYPTIGFVGELHPRKGVHVLLEALQQVDSTCELVLLGNGDADYTAELEDVAGRSRHPVHFLGFRDDVQDLYHWIDLLVLPSLNFESFGMVIIEAMRFGIPVICSDFGGMKEVVADGETGLVVPAGDPQALADAMNRLLGDAVFRGRMGKAGRARMERQFSSDTMTKNYVRFFHAE